MKLTVPRTFDSGPIIKAFAKADIQDSEEFVSYMADATEQLIKSVKQGLSIEDNFSGEVRELTLKHNTVAAVNVKNQKQTVRHMIPTYCADFDNPIEAFSWQYDDKGGLRVRAIFRNAPTASIQVRVVILY